MTTSSTVAIPARIAFLEVRNFQALREIEFKRIRPVTVRLGRTGIGRFTETTHEHR